MVGHCTIEIDFDISSSDIVVCSCDHKNEEIDANMSTLKYEYLPPLLLNAIYIHREPMKVMDI